MNKKGVIISSVLLGCLIVLGLGYSMFNHTTRETKERPIATTMAQLAIFDRLGVDLVAVPSSSEPLPKRYANLPKVGNHVSVNFEQIIKTKPSVVYVDNELTGDYGPQLQQHHIKMQALDFNDYAHLQASIKQLGTIYGRTKQAQQLNAAIKLPQHKLNKPVKVLLLMGMPGGAFLVANQQSYLGDLVKRAGGQVVAGSPSSIYTTANPQLIAKANPDVVIRLAHAMPASVKQDFQQTFKQAPYNTLTATKKGHVYDVSAPEFSMSANLHVVEAYQQIYRWLEAAS